MTEQSLDLGQPLETIIKSAGAILMSYFRTEFPSREKEQGGPVTPADLASEKYLIEHLKGLVPQASFFAEESGASGTNDDYCWVIDPLDGTTNFIHGLPYFCISVALTFKGKPIVAAIYQPLLDDFYYAQKGQGAFLNGKKILVSSATSLQKSMILVGLPMTYHDTYHDLIEKLPSLGPKLYSFRHLGAAALDCAYVASGRLDAVFFTGLAWWDVAAGMLLIEQAGGIVTDFQGNALTQDYRSCIGANKQIFNELRQLLIK